MLVSAHCRLVCFLLIGRLGKAKITQSSITFLNNSCNVTLTCSVEKEEKNVTYSWSPLGERSNVLQIFQSPEDQNLTYTCTAQNPVSNSSDSVAAQQLCTGNQLHPSLLESLRDRSEELQGLTFDLSSHTYASSMLTLALAVSTPR